MSVAVAGALLSVTPPVPAAAATHVVVIDKMKFAPVPPLKVGDTVVFENKDMFRHTVTASNNSFNLDLMPGAIGGLHLNSAGHAAFYCKYHPGMRGTMVAK
jgi:plastocyanin